MRRAVELISFSSNTFLQSFKLRFTEQHGEKIATMHVTTFCIEHNISTLRILFLPDGTIRLY